MAIDFMTALRSKARSQERGARLAGRPLTQVEAAAPYYALADTAGETYRAGKSVELAEKAQATQAGQYGTTLEFQKQAEADRVAETKRAQAEAERANLERERLQAVQLAESRRVSDLQLKLAEEANEPSAGGQITGTVVGAAGGAYLGATKGAALGSAFAPPVGTIVGGILGALAGFFTGKKCIIISACTSPESYEVNLSREFRDRYLGPITLLGYYRLASLVAPRIDDHRAIRWLVFNGLVKRLVDYGEWVLGYKSKRTRPFSQVVSKAFLGLCKIIGKGVIR